MAEGLTKAVQKFLRSEEMCVCAGDAKFLKKTGKRRARVVAVVYSRSNQREAAIFALKSKRFQQTCIKGIYPITADFSLHESASGFDIVYDTTGETYTFDVNNGSTLAQLVRAINDAVLTSQGNDASRDAPAANSFAWTRYYSVVTDGDTETTNSGAGTSSRGRSPSASSGTSSFLTQSVTNTEGTATGIYAGPSTSTGAILTDMITIEEADPLKEQMLEQMMKSREEEFTDTVDIITFMGTWNVNGKDVNESLDKWLIGGEAVPDIYAIGFQELDLSAETFLLNNSQKAERWETKIEASLAKQGRYTQVLSKQLVGILLCIYVKEEHKDHISAVQADHAGVGIMGMMGNKGGVAIRFNFFDSRMCFVNSHLAARQANVDRRNADQKEICRRLCFTDPDTRVQYTIFNHDFLFWEGDLNYRIDMDDDEVKARIAEEDWDALMACDQLSREMSENRTFAGFIEGPIDFCPTYKYDPGTNRFDTSEKKRTPAWCDRVLWRESEHVEQLSYGRHELMSSDHKPVSAVFLTRVKVVVADRRNEVHNEILRELDKMDNSRRPDAALNSSHFTFEQVRYATPSTLYLEVQNIGQVIIKYSFTPKPDDTGARFCKPWLWVQPPVGMIMPGEKTSISLTVMVDNETAPYLNMHEDKLEDILILHLENGKDYFINIRGEYLRSCFGCSLPVLTSLPTPIRNADLSALGESKKLSIPKELWRIVDFLFENGMDTEDIFLESGDAKEMAFVRECLDMGADLRSFQGSVHSVAETLVRFLEALAEPVIPYKLLPRCLECSNNEAQCQALVNVLPTESYNVFVYVTSFLRELLAHSHTNNLSADRLSVVFASVLLREEDAHVRRGVRINAPDNSRKKAAFLSHFLH